MLERDYEAPQKRVNSSMIAAMDGLKDIFQPQVCLADLSKFCSPGGMGGWGLCVTSCRDGRAEGHLPAAGVLVLARLLVQMLAGRMLSIFAVCGAPPLFSPCRLVQEWRCGLPALPQPGPRLFCAFYSCSSCLLAPPAERSGCAPALSWTGPHQLVTGRQASHPAHRHAWHGGGRALDAPGSAADGRGTSDSRGGSPGVETEGRPEGCQSGCRTATLVMWSGQSCLNHLSSCKSTHQSGATAVHAVQRRTQGNNDLRGRTSCRQAGRTMWRCAWWKTLQFARRLHLCTLSTCHGPRLLLTTLSPAAKHPGCRCWVLPGCRC